MKNGIAIFIFLTLGILSAHAARPVRIGCTVDTKGNSCSPQQEGHSKIRFAPTFQNRGHIPVEFKWGYSDFDCGVEDSVCPFRHPVFLGWGELAKFKDTTTLPEVWIPGCKFIFIQLLSHGKIEFYGTVK